eukprot:jgi/Orpsp1_1/1174147/evm.model.c7180000049081.1
MGLLSLVAFSFAKMKEVSNDCTDIKNYLVKNERDYYDIINGCEVNEEGKVTF